MAVSGVLLALGSFRGAGVALLAGGVCDMLDGAVARDKGATSRFGAFFDSTSDRLAEMLFFAGLLVHYTAVDPSVLYALLLPWPEARFRELYARARASASVPGRHDGASSAWCCSSSPASSVESA
jgi:phosphatidylglycerophosphate synthase